LAKRRHTTLVRMRPEEEARKLAVYAEIWGRRSLCHHTTKRRARRFKAVHQSPVAYKLS
jgi:hypothetical protein